MTPTLHIITQPDDQLALDAIAREPSHATILTGHYPPVHGVRDNARFDIAKASTTLAERLGRAGYETAAFVGAFPVAGAFGFARGFSVFDEGFHGTGQGQVAERPANEVADAAVGWLRARGARPFLAWVHFYDPHAHFTPPAWTRELFPSPYPGPLGGLLGHFKKLTPETMPALAENYRNAKAPDKCVHCHHVWTGLLTSTWKAGTEWMSSASMSSVTLRFASRATEAMSFCATSASSRLRRDSALSKTAGS